MTRRSFFGAAVLVLACCFCLASAVGAAPPEASTPARGTPGETVTGGPGLLLGVVTDASGAPLQETLVSATGPAGTALALCDADGQFEIRGLAPGVYLLRTHLAGFAPAERHVVEVLPGEATVRAFTLRRTPDGNEPLTAGFGPAPPGRLLDLLEVELEAAQAEGSEAQDSGGLREGGRPAVGRATAPHDDSEKAWWLRRARRSVLKDAGQYDIDDELSVANGPISVSYPRRTAEYGSHHDVTAGLPFSGQFHLLTRASVGSRSELMSTDILPGQIAYMSVGGPEQAGAWGFQSAVTTGDAGSLVVAGTYATEFADHAMTVGASYSRQHLRSTTDTTLSLDAASAANLETRREVGSLSADGTWTPGRRVALDYGLNVAKYGYLEQDALYSPSTGVTVSPLEKTRVRVAASQYMLAPGAEEFLPPAQGVWLPPERTFAPLAEGALLRAEQTRHFEVAVERDLGQNSTIAVRRYVQDIQDQMITMFGARPGTAHSSSDHYYLTRADGISADGWGVTYRHVLAGRVRSSVDYSVTQADWAPWMVSGLSPVTVGVLRSGRERFHDVTATIETEVPETATRVFVVYRVNTAFAIHDAASQALTTGLAGRFAFRVKQSLPFSPIGGSEWEVLVDVRSLFRDPVAGASVYDELLVVAPPKQVVGGLVVHF